MGNGVPSRGPAKMIDNWVVNNVCKQNKHKRWNLGGMLQFLSYADRIVERKKTLFSLNTISPQWKSGALLQKKNVVHYILLNINWHTHKFLQYRPIPRATKNGLSKTATFFASKNRRLSPRCRFWKCWSHLCDGFPTHVNQKKTTVVAIWIKLNQNWFVSSWMGHEFFLIPSTWWISRSPGNGNKH